MCPGPASPCEAQQDIRVHAWQSPQRYRELLEPVQAGLRKYNGIPGKHFFLFPQECEFRFNHDSPCQPIATLKARVGIWGLSESALLAGSGTCGRPTMAAKSG